MRRSRVRSQDVNSSARRKPGKLRHCPRLLHFSTIPAPASVFCCCRKLLIDPVVLCAVYGFVTMLRPLGRRPWTCRKCLLQLQSRAFESASSPAPRPHVDYVPADNSAPGKNADDDTLRRVFDSQPFWREFSHHRTAAAPKQAGLVQNQYLTSPDGFRVFASFSLQKCQEVVAKVLQASTLDEYRALARNLDRLSDLLCRVIDLSDFYSNNTP